jgi:ubiquinone biosynthesis protein Coq4
MNLINNFKGIKQQAKTLRQQLGFAQAFFRLINDPNNTMLVFELQEHLLKASTPQDTEKVVEMFKQDPVLGAMLEDRYLAPDYKITDLANSQLGTLGYAYYRHMHDNGFTPDFFPPVKPVDELTYFELRMRQTHDIWHVVTGFSPSVEDEVGLQAFYAAQLKSPFNMVLIAAGVLHAAIRNQQLTVPIMEAIRLGWENGKAARPIAAVKWEEMWERPLEEIRREYNVKPARALYDFAPQPLAQTQAPELAPA